MGTIYRIERNLASGWRVRLECVPYDANLSASRTNVDGVALLELGTLSAAFDGLPFGMQKETTLNFTLRWGALPTALQTYLKDGYDTSTGDRNIWLLWTDRGTSGGTWSLEYAGTEDNVESLDLEPLGNGEFSYAVELVDIVYYAMKTATVADGFSTAISQQKVRKLYQRRQFVTDQTVYSSLKLNQYYDLTTLGMDADLADISYTFTVPLSEVSTSTWQLLARTAGATGMTNTNAGQIPYRACRLYAPDLDVPLLITDPLEQPAKTTAATKAYYVTGIYLKNDRVGGMHSTQDTYSFAAQTESVYDVLRQLCEQFGAKISYVLSYVATPGAEALTVTWNVENILQGRGKAVNDDTSNVTLSLDSALEIGTLSVRGENVLKAEARYETSSEADVTELANIVQGSRGSRSYNVDFRLHSNTVRIPGGKPAYDGIAGPMDVTNLIWLRGVDNYTSPTPAPAAAADFAILPHSNVRYVYGPGANDYVEYDYGKDVLNPTDLPYLHDMADVTKNIDKAQAYIQWLQTFQLNGGMPATWCKMVLHVFANERNARLTVSWPMTISEYVLPHMIGSRHTLTGTMASTFDQIDWTQAIVTEVSTDYVAGTSEVVYQIIAA